MATTDRIRESIFLSTLVWAWAIHHLPMFEGGIDISLSVSAVSYPVAVLAAYLAVYKRQIILTAILLMVTLVLTQLHFNYSLPEIGESLLIISATGMLYMFGLRHMIRLMEQRLEPAEARQQAEIRQD